MEELDAKVEKINYDLMGLENRKKEMEDDKLNTQKEIDKLEKEKNKILDKIDNMKTLQKLIYIAISLRTDLKRVDLINVKISEYQKSQTNIQNKIDIQNGLYADTIKEKEKVIEQRKELYISKDNIKVEIQANKSKSPIESLKQIYEITKQFKDNKVMKDLNQLVGRQIKPYITNNFNKQENIIVKEQQEEME